jgi:hypothetical protein
MPLKSVALLPPIEKVRRRRGVFRETEMRRVLPDHDQLIRVSVGQRPKKDRVNDTEDGAVRADPERQRQHRNRGECGVLGQHAQAVFHVLSEVSDHIAFPLCAHRRGVLRDAAFDAFQLAA